MKGKELKLLKADDEQHLFDLVKYYYRHLHQFPEIALHEFKTSSFIVSLLKEWGYQEIHSELAGTGVVAVLRGEEETSILLRADMDALPVAEETGLPFASRISNMMHACGHDGHTAILLVTAYQMIQMVKAGLKLRQGIKFCFQPGEENAGGARKMLDDNKQYDVLESAPKVKHCFGLHLISNYPCHQIGYHTGSFCANSDRWEIHINGKGGHCSGPEFSIDAIQVAINIANSIYQIRGRQVSQTAPSTISIGKIKAGDVYNIISDSAMLAGSVRTMSNQDQKTIFKAFENICLGAQAQFPGSRVEFRQISGNKLINNSPEIEPFVQKALNRIGPITNNDMLLGGEDFSEFAEKVPSAFFTLGASPENQEYQISHHSPLFRIDERALLTGVKIWLSVIQDWIE